VIQESTAVSPSLASARRAPLYGIAIASTDSPWSHRPDRPTVSSVLRTTSPHQLFTILSAQGRQSRRRTGSTKVTAARFNYTPSLFFAFR
jgi:hypothetical protein